MDNYTLIIVIAIAAFVIALVVLSVVYLKGRRKDQGVIKPSFGRHSLPQGVGIDEVRKPIFAERKEEVEGRGRLYAFGIFIAAVFGTIAVRLWSLQLMSGDTYTAEAAKQSTAETPMVATRGRILDRNGNVLVGNQPTLRIMAPKSVVDNPIVVQMLALILGIPKGIIRKNLLDDNQGAQSNRLVADEVPMNVVAFIKEHPQLFTDVEIVERNIRVYPNGNAGAHILGYIGPVTKAEMAIPGRISYSGGDLIGKDGAELAFENLLQGTKGTRTYRQDVDGNPLYLISEAPPKNGADVRLTIDINIQKATDRILSDIIHSAQTHGFSYADAGALVCIDIEDGGILASSSYPTFDPAQLANTADEDVWAALLDENAKQPLFNRVLSGEYPAASTFKAFTGLAGLQHGVVVGDTHHNCTGLWHYDETDERWPQRCWIHPSGHGYLGLEEAINQSCDVFFYNIGAGFYNKWANQFENARTDLMQDYLKSWGFGERTGIELSGESRGRIPSHTWKKETWPDEPERTQWNPGDMSNMSIGQGDILVTPLQIANGYAGIARQKMLKPHVLHSVLNSEGQETVTYKSVESDLKPEFDEYFISRIKDGLRRVAVRMGGKFNELPVNVSGKSGTAEVASANAEFNWFAAYAPMEEPKYCVACLIEQGGDGSNAALLGVQHTLAAIYGVDLGEIVVESAVRER